MTRNLATRRPFSRALIEESDLAHCLHILLQNHGLMPGIVMGLRTQNDPVTPGERAFVMASTKKAWNEGFMPVKIANFAKKKEGE